MPLSEFLKRAGKLGSGQQKMASTTDLSSFPENEFVELVWENGQLMMQGQSSRPKKRTTFNNLSSNASNIRGLENSSSSKIGKCGAMNSMLNDMPLSVPTREVDMSQEDDVVPWLSYSADDSLQQDYCSQLLPDISGVAANEPSRQMTGGSHSVPNHNVENLEQRNASKISPNSRLSMLHSWSPQKGHASVPSLGSGFSDIVSSNTSNATASQSGFATLDKKGCSDRSIGGSHNVQIHNDNLEQRNTPKVYPTSRFGQLSSWSPQKGHASVPSLGSGVSNIVSSNTINNPVSGFGNSNQSQASDGGIKRMTIQKQNMTSGDSSLFNFAHCSRPSTFHKGSLNGESAVAGSSIVAVKGNNERGNVASCSNPVSANPVEPHFSSEKENDLHFQPKMASSKVDLETSLPSHLDRSCPVEQSDNLCRDNTSNNDKSPGQFTGESATKEYPDGKRNVEPAVACSSVCSASSAERASSAQPHNRKRKSHDNEESGCRSEDVEEESFGVKRAGHVHRSAGSKRGRAAEVHNLSERKRRDRINEKMRALQELIPNCNRADKASMLDEAIEYLKTLQLQIQIMSMGAGLCAPHMMFPMGMGHMPATHMPHFSPMGLRMGMGFGMGMHDNGGSPGCPIFPMPTPPQGAHFPSPPVTGSTIFPALSGYNLHAFGHPGQGPPISAPQAPFVPLAGQPSKSSAVGLNAARTGVHADTPSQVQATNEAQDKSAFVAEK